MKIKIRAIAMVFILSLPAYAYSQSSKVKNQQENPHTILWKISGNNLKQPSYLLGINHIMSANWLYNFPEIEEVINSSSYLLTEHYGNNSDANFGSKSDNNAVKLPENKVKALDILTLEQFRVLDSFFVARVGEGIVNNKDAEEMDVFEMSSAIFITLLTPEGDDYLPSMDRELFGIFQQQGKPSFGMDRLKYLAFDKSEKEKAKEIIKPFIEAARLGYYPGWNIADTTQGVGNLIHSYKEMSFNYKLDEKDPEEKSLIANQTIKERNQMWLSAIEGKISEQDCLIAVGFFHLCYESGLISLLRNKGYIVEPVELEKS